VPDGCGLHPGPAQVSAIEISVGSVAWSSSSRAATMMPSGSALACSTASISVSRSGPPASPAGACAAAGVLITTTANAAAGHDASRLAALGIVAVAVLAPKSVGRLGDVPPARSVHVARAGRSKWPNLRNMPVSQMNDRCSAGPTPRPARPISDGHGPDLHCCGVCADHDR
jgi:hypothetical protein